jgi:hypothetical protein
MDKWMDVLAEGICPFIHFILVAGIVIDFFQVCIKSLSIVMFFLEDKTCLMERKSKSN